MALPVDVIELGIVRKGFKEYSHPGLLDLDRVALEGLRDLAKKTERDSLESLASTSSKGYSQQTPAKPQWTGISLKNNESLDGGKVVSFKDVGRVYC